MLKAIGRLLGFNVYIQLGNQLDMYESNRLCTEIRPKRVYYIATTDREIAKITIKNTKKGTDTLIPLN